ncbi:NAD-dependent DNA ligase LigA, partial [Patescibacteria group bacterium]|nr:NAD-dependent DNA ligase LigA [Patescibacteria group bacterium]
MTKTEAVQRVAKLRQEINRQRYLVQVLDQSDLSEAALDSLKHELAQLEQQYPELITPDSPTQRIAGEPLEGFVKVRHLLPLLSLNDIFSFEELDAWRGRLERILGGNGAERLEQSGYYAELKLDGFSISLVYEDGRLIRAATRGDGYVGEDVTVNARTIEAIPLALELAASLPKDLSELAKRALQGRFEVRGEVYLNRKDFEEINERQTAKGLPTYANPRNLAAGSMRQLDPRLVAERQLRFFAFAVVGEW